MNSDLQIWQQTSLRIKLCFSSFFHTVGTMSLTFQGHFDMWNSSCGPGVKALAYHSPQEPEAGTLQIHNQCGLNSSSRPISYVVRYVLRKQNNANVIIAVVTVFLGGTSASMHQLVSAAVRNTGTEPQWPWNQIHLIWNQSLLSSRLSLSKSVIFSLKG